MVLSSLILFAVIASLLGYFFLPRSQPEIVERIPVAVADFVNETKEEELDGLSGMLITALEQSRRLSVLTRSRMFDVLKQMDREDVDRINEELGRKICRRANVKTQVVASIRKFGKLYTIDLKIIDLEKNEHLFVTNETSEGQESIPAMIDKLSEETRVGFKERAAEIRAASRKADAAVGASAAALCIVFGYQDFDSYYYVNFNSEPGLTALHRINNGAEVNLVSYNQATFADGNYHTLRLERSGSQIRAFFDGKQLFSVTDGFFGKGEIGLGSFNDSGYFDDVQIDGDACPQMPLFTEVPTSLQGTGWNKSTDNETPSSGLTYNLRLGTIPGGNEVMSPMSEVSNGFRRVVRLGNTNHNTHWTIQNLPSGRYYWSVQALDHAFAGSTFAPEQTFVLGDTVWPGDTNNNRLVNQADVLPIGLYWNKTGPKRDDASIIWKGQVALPWSPEAATFADANGDGIVNQADVLPIGLNWGRTRTASAFVLGKSTGASEASAATPTLGVKITGDTNPGKTFWLDVHADSVTNLFGLSFELLYVPTAYLHVDTAIAGTWLGDDLVFLSYIDTTTGKISLAVSRKAPTFLFSNLKRKVGGGRDSSGVVARIKMRMSSAAVRGQVTTLTLQNVAANDPAGNPIQFNVINGSIITSVASRQQNEPVPQAFTLYPNTPNPFNPSTTIQYDLPEAAEIRLEIFDMLGRRVRSLVNQRQQAGRYSVVWDGRNENGQTVASGAYIYQLRAATPVKGEAGSFVQNRKMLLLQ